MAGNDLIATRVRRRLQVWTVLVSAVIWCCAGLGPAGLGAAEPIPEGSAKVVVTIRGLPLDVFTYRPEGTQPDRLIVVCHGVLRNAEEYRDHAIELGRRCSAVIAAPYFDLERFPIWKYQHGGVMFEGELQPREQWTWTMVPELLTDLKQRMDQPEARVHLLGHSGGAQFLARMAAFVPLDVDSIVVANPGTHLLPTRELPYPYGFGNLPEELATSEVWRQYLAQPVSLYLGTRDTEVDEHLDVKPDALAQGPHRWERGQRAFSLASHLAESEGWQLNWKLVIADGVGHDHQLMFDHPACLEALFRDGLGVDADPE